LSFEIEKEDEDEDEEELNRMIFCLST